jgi:hypothetical protein
LLRTFRHVLPPYSPASERQFRQAFADVNLRPLKPGSCAQRLTDFQRFHGNLTPLRQLFD